MALSKAAKWEVKPGSSLASLFCSGCPGCRGITDHSAFVSPTPPVHDPFHR